MSSTRKATLTALCIALCAVLPLAFHALGLGAAFSPLHIAPLLCGLLCGGWYGFFCGAAGALISSLSTGMPAAAQLAYMIPELAAYGLFTGLLYRLFHSGNPVLDLYLALIPAMLLGRVVGGLARGLYLGGSYSLGLWAGSYLLGSLPGIVTHLILIPALVLILTRARLISPGDTKEAEHESAD